ncbi:hypothetical protein [Symbiobacterium terraclitae]|uniref:hypothetical protein n=1 Tax=Symbiobacterium terraclitae TaxID=557451 RepID=UPI0035B565C7
MTSLLRHLSPSYRLDRLAADLAQLDLGAPNRPKIWVTERGGIRGRVDKLRVEDIAYLIVHGKIPDIRRRDLLKKHERELRLLVQRSKRKSAAYDV